MKTKELIAEISDLPINQQAKIANHILKNMNAPDPEIEEAWIQEVERRAAEVESGEVELIPGKKVFKELRAIVNE